MAITKNARAYTGGKYNLTFDGQTDAGWIKSVEGGNATADVVVEKMGADHIARKHLATVKYEDISFQCGTGMTTTFYDWINTAFNHTSNDAGRRTGAINHYDYDYNLLSALEFRNGLITEFGMPALDASSKDAALMTVKFAGDHPQGHQGFGQGWQPEDGRGCPEEVAAVELPSSLHRLRFRSGSRQGEQDRSAGG